MPRVKINYAEMIFWTARGAILEISSPASNMMKADSRGAILDDIVTRKQHDEVGPHEEQLRMI